MGDILDERPKKASFSIRNSTGVISSSAYNLVVKIAHYPKRLRRRILDVRSHFSRWKRDTVLAIKP